MAAATAGCGRADVDEGTPAPAGGQGGTDAPGTSACEICEVSTYNNLQGTNENGQKTYEYCPDTRTLSDGRVVWVFDDDGRLLILEVTSPDGPPVSRALYEYDEAGNPTAMIHEAAGSQSDATSVYYTNSYDEEGRLVAVDTVSGDESRWSQTTYGYDASGRMTSRERYDEMYTGGLRSDIAWDGDRVVQVVLTLISGELPWPYPMIPAWVTFAYDDAGHLIQEDSGAADPGEVDSAVVTRRRWEYAPDGVVSRHWIDQERYMTSSLDGIADYETTYSGECAAAGEREPTIWNLPDLPGGVEPVGGI